MLLHVLMVLFASLGSACNVRLQTTETTYENLTLLSPSYCEGMRVQGYLFYDVPVLVPPMDFLVNATQIRLIEVNSEQDLPTTIRDSAALGVNATILILSAPPLSLDPSSLGGLLISIPPLDGSALRLSLSKSDAPVWLLIDLPTDCSLYRPVAYVWTVVSLVWILFLALWLCNNYYWNPQYVWTFHKLLTLLLAFKVLNVYCAYSKLSACPFDTAPAMLLAILQSVCRTLYETSFFTLLLVLSSGLFLIRSELDRGCVNYISAFVAMLYLAISAENMLEEDNYGLIFGVIGAVWGNCALFGTAAIMKIRKMMRENERLRVSEHTLRVKKKYLLLLLSVEHVYFTIETATHLCARPLIHHFTTDKYYSLAASISLHEAIELLSVGVVFWLYSVTAHIQVLPLSRYTVVPRAVPIPVYRSLECGKRITMDVPASTPVLVVNPTCRSMAELRDYTLAYLPGNEAEPQGAITVEMSRSVGREAG